MGAGAIVAIILAIFMTIWMALAYTNTLCSNKLVGHGLCYNTKYCVGGFGNCNDTIKPILPSECAVCTTSPASPAHPCPGAATSCYTQEPMAAATGSSEIVGYEKA
jgi:hypothetical protein